jgi:hypothetical protein
MIRRLDANRLRTILSAFYTSTRAQAETEWPWTPLLTRARDELTRLRSRREKDTGRKAA